MTTIDLHLPTSWNGCTTADLEAIAAAIIAEQQRTDRYHPFDWSRVKLSVVLAINGLVVASLAGDNEYMVTRHDDKEPWPITTEQLLALTERLAWIDDKKSNKTIYQFPYPDLTLTINHSPLTIVGPQPLLDGYTWQEYRYLTDWMQEYMRCTNARQDATEPMAQFLAVLFKPAPSGDNPANREPLTLNPESFASFDAIKWQVILFWWSSLMALLQQKFPRVFKPQPVGRGQKKNETPWDFYNRVTAMLADEYKSSEADQQNETYGVTLQKLQNMADKAAELERVKARHS